MGGGGGVVAEISTGGDWIGVGIGFARGGVGAP
jgi:hypothetical protein